jgi:hypothetical protein
MNEADVIATVRAHIESKFPMACSKCGHEFMSLKDYLRYTTHLGDPVSYDAELKNWRPSTPVGTISFANCRCGTTLSISSQGMGLMTMWRLLWWARTESARRHVETRALLEDLREKIDQQVLGESAAKPSADAARR